MRELNIVYMLGRGYPASEIAKRFGVATQYMHLCIQAIYRKTGTKNRNHLVYWMLDQGYLEYPLYRGKKRSRPTPAQLEVVEQLARGYTLAAIAYRLGVTADGLQKRLGRLHKNLGTRTSAHLVAICWEEDWYV